LNPASHPVTNDKLMGDLCLSSARGASEQVPGRV